MSAKIFDVLVVGSGLSSMIFCEEYLKKKKLINVISPDFKKTKQENNLAINFNSLPPQYKKSLDKILDYFKFNNIFFDKDNCNILGSLEFGGLSNYWGLQLDKNIKDDLKGLSFKTKHNIINCFNELLKEKKLLGNFEKKKNNFILDRFYENYLKLNKKKLHNFFLEKPILAIQGKNSQNTSISTIEKKITKLEPKSIFENLKNKIKIHNYYVESFSKKKNLIYISCVNNSIKKIFITKKLILASGTIVSTKLIIDYLNFKKEVSLKHHPRLISMYFARNKIKSNLDFTPGLLQVKSKTNSKTVSVSDVRPSNTKIITSGLKIFPFLKPFKFILMFLKNYILLSNTLLGSSESNLFIKKQKNFFLIYSKKKNLLKKLKHKQRDVYKFLRNQKIIFPFFKNFFPGVGGDYHYFGTVEIGKKGILSVDEKCRLKNNNEIYVIDGCVFNFKKNMYPLGLVMANAKRVAKILN